jgi:hypothetical protein
MIRLLKTAFISIFFLALVFSPAAMRRAPAQEETAWVSASMKSYYHLPGERAYLHLELALPETLKNKAVDIDLLIYSSATTRSYLATFNGGTRRYPIIRRTLETIPAGGEWSGREYELDLQALGLRTGVYPFEIRLSQGGKTLASDHNYLVVMDPSAGYPLNLCLLFNLSFPPAYDAQGNSLDGSLASACSSSPSENGFLYSLASALKQAPDVSTSMVIPYTTYQDMVFMSGFPEKGDAQQGAARILQLLKEMSESGQIDILATTYSHADTDYLSSLGWEDEASAQMSKGQEGATEMGAKGRGFIPPLFRLSDSLLQRLAQFGSEFTVVGEEAVQWSEAGHKIMEGTTLSQPVKFTSKDGHTLKAFVRDASLFHYLEEPTSQDAAHMVQYIMADLAVLQREKPYAVRSCVLAFPPSFIPSREFLEEMIKSVKSCPWLKARTLTDLNQGQFSMEGVILPAPTYDVTPSSYSQKLGELRRDAQAFSQALMEGNPLREELANYILIAENHRFMEENDATAGQKYLDSIRAVLQGETSSIRIERKRSVTLSSTQGNLAVDITSGLDYPIEATLRLENASLSFPDGNLKKVIVEPRENRFVFSVITHRKGSFKVDIFLEANGLLIDGTSTTLNTSIINTLAIVLLIALSFLAVVVASLKRLSRKLRGGKHSKTRKDR